MAICYTQISFHNFVQNKRWKKAEKYYRKSIKLFSKTDHRIEAINAELNLQIMYYISGQKFDIERIKEITYSLEEAGDSRAGKGYKILKELE